MYKWDEEEPKKRTGLGRCLEPGWMWGWAECWGSGKEQCDDGIRYDACSFPSGSCHRQGPLEMGHSHHGGGWKGAVMKLVDEVCWMAEQWKEKI